MIYKSIFTLLIIIFSYNFSWAYSFDDEFSGSSVDTTAWLVVDRQGDTSNSEQECYHPANVTESGGYLTITEKQETIPCTGTSTTYNYTSGQVVWKTYNFTYGQIDISAKLGGDWPAIWLLGSDCQAQWASDPGNNPPCNWPNPGSEEIDIVETSGSDLGEFGFNMHTNGYNGSICTVSIDTTQWHTYSLVWSAGKLALSVDGSQRCSLSSSSVPSTPMFLIMNIARNSSYQGGSLPATTQIDYVRVTSAGPPDTQPPTTPTNLLASAVSSSQINLTWTASTDNVAVTGYQVESCQGVGCTSFAQIATVTGTTYNNTGLSAGTSYSYRVRATDAAGNLSGFSNIAAVTTLDTTPPTAPSNLTASAVSETQVNLAWTASTDNVGVTGYQVQRCQGASCTSFSQVGTATGTAYSDNGLLAGTSYRYQVRATDAAGNLSGFSNIAAVTTLDTTPPTAPLNLVATAASSSQIKLTWTASTDNVKVIGYKIYRCAGSGCTPSSQLTTAAGTSYSDTGLSASTVYVYAVSAYDAAGNESAKSSSATATTQADTTRPAAPTHLMIQ